MNYEEADQIIEILWLVWLCLLNYILFRKYQYVTDMRILYSQFHHKVSLSNATS